jgi:phosphohistidine phosphatase SixA
MIRYASTALLALVSSITAVSQMGAATDYASAAMTSAAPRYLQDSMPMVILVRHAEKAAAPAGDPALSDAGKARAAALVSTLAGAGVTAIITTEFTRTRETAAPLAARIGVTPQVVAARGMAGAAHVAATLTAIRSHTRGVVLVVGHSNTVPAIIAALGAARMRDLCESDYDNLFVVHRGGASPAAGAAGDEASVRGAVAGAAQPTTAALLRTRFGAPDGVELEQGSCSGNMPQLP